MSYILQVKANQKNLLENIKDSFQVKRIVQIDINEDCGHGRVEVRKCSVITDLEFIDNAHKWTDLQTIIRIETEIYNKKTKKTTNNTRYYISFLPKDAKLINKFIRTHWTIENNLHWSLDIVLKEDNQAKRNNISKENYNLIAKFALYLLEQEETLKKSKPNKRFRASINDGYREIILGV